MKTLVIIPAYNEEINMGDIIKRTKEFFPEIDILVIDDGSLDKTAMAALKAGAVVARHPFNIGYGAALQTGYKYADKNRYDFIIQMDADGQHDPRFIKELLESVKSGLADVVVGSRFISGVKYKAPLLRKSGMFLFSTLVSLITRQRITDSTSGFQALNKKACTFLTGDIYPCDYPDADVIIMLHRSGFSIREIPSIMYSSNGLKSMHNGFKPIYYVFKMILSIFVMLLRNNSNVKKQGGKNAF